MVCCERWAVIWVRRSVMALVGLSCVVLGPSMSLAQYPGSAGDLDNGGFGASSSASNGSSSDSSSSSGGVSSNGSSASSASGSMADSDSYAGGDGSDGHFGFGSTTAATLPPRKALRKRSLIRQFRLEFAKTLTFETANKRPLHALSADVFLDQFSKELDSGLGQQADIDSLGRDLGLVRDALDEHLDKLISSSGDDAPRRNFFSKTLSAGKSAPELQAEIRRLKLKHELLQFGEYSLQAMGYFDR